MTDRNYTIVSKVYTDVANGTTDFGIRDLKGRAVGYRWSIKAVKATPLEDQNHGGYVIYPGTPLDHFEVWTTPTRDGDGYGPAFNTAKAATLEEANKIVTKRTEAARKRDTKKFGGK